MWTAVQRGLDELLVSPAVKRRAGIELRCKGVDADVVAAGEMVDGYKRSLKVRLVPGDDGDDPFG